MAWSTRTRSIEGISTPTNIVSAEVGLLRVRVCGSLLFGSSLLLCGCATVPGKTPAILSLEDGQEELPADQQDPMPERVPQFGGENSVGGQLNEDRRLRESIDRFTNLQRWLAPYFDFKEHLSEEHGLSFGLDYTALYLGSSASLGQEDAAGGLFRFFGNWTLTGRGTDNTGSAVFKVENRHTLGTDVPPSGLGFENGYVGLPGTIFNDGGWMLTNLYWMQRTMDGRLNFVAGWVDATDYLDIYGLINPWMSFSNLVFLTGSGTIPAPDQALGAAAATMLGEHFYTVAGITDRNSNRTDPAEGFDSFFNTSEFFTHVEFGWVPSYEERYLSNVHLTLWHADEREQAQELAGWGGNFSASYFIDEKWMPFLRAGYADDGGALLERSVSAGVGYYVKERRDVVALGLNWGRPSKSTFSPGLDDQYTAELFYRLQLSESFTVSPSMQYVVDPALNPADHSLFYFGLRARVSL